MSEKKKDSGQVEDFRYTRDMSDRQREWREARLKAIRRLEEYIEYAHRPKHVNDKSES